MPHIYHINALPRLKSSFTTEDIYWSPAWEYEGARGGFNSYCLVYAADLLPRTDEDFEFVTLEDVPVVLCCINGMGELRWTVSPRALRRFMQRVSTNPPLATEPWKTDDVEHHQAFRYFGLEIRAKGKPARMTRHDMLVKLTSDFVNAAEQQSLAGNRTELEEWLSPIIYEHLARSQMAESDEGVADFYTSQLGTYPPGWEE